MDQSSQRFREDSWSIIQVRNAALKFAFPHVSQMDPSKIQVPKVTDGARYSLLYALYLHSTAALLRTAVSYFNGAHTGFDKDLVLKTPGLGNGTVSVSVCLPPQCERKSAREIQTSSPLVLVIEGGGFVLGQPKDGRKNDRLIANKVFSILINSAPAMTCRH
jgi:acetyl esterase